MLRYFEGQWIKMHNKFKYLETFSIKAPVVRWMPTAKASLSVIA